MPKRPKSSHRSTETTSNKTDPYMLTRKADDSQVYADIHRSSDRWRRVRKIQLTNFPMCQDPFSLHSRDYIDIYLSEAQEVHHIIRAVDDSNHIYTLDNLASLCRHCHSKISRKEKIERCSYLSIFKHRQFISEYIKENNVRYV